MSTTFLFGAGASYGSGPCHPYAPPLGKDLFHALAKRGVAGTVGADLAATFVADFEAGMDRFWNERNTDTTALLRDMAKYFAPFEPREGNLYLELIRVMGRNRRYVMATTNYDLLIEISASMLGLHTAYVGLPSPPQNVSVLKIHGSCNFLPDIRPNQFSGISFDLSGSGGAILEAGVRIATSAQEIIGFCEAADSIAPAIAMYSPSKRVLFCREFVESQKQAWRESMSKASRVYLIGMRVHEVDTHIWGEIAKAKVPVYYVGREPDEFNAWAKSVKLRTGRVLATSFADALPLIAEEHGYRRPRPQGGSFAPSPR